MLQSGRGRGAPGGGGGAGASRQDQTSSSSTFCSPPGPRPGACRRGPRVRRIHLAAVHPSASEAHLHDIASRRAPGACRGSPEEPPRAQRPPQPGARVPNPPSRVEGACDRPERPQRPRLSLGLGGGGEEPAEAPKQLRPLGQGPPPAGDRRQGGRAPALPPPPPLAHGRTTHAEASGDLHGTHGVLERDRGLPATKLEHDSVTPPERPPRHGRPSSGFLLSYRGNSREK